MHDLAQALGQLKLAQERIAALESENAALKQQVTASTPAARIAEPFSLRAEEKRQEIRGRKRRKESKKQRCGRIANDDKLPLAATTEDVYPSDVPRNGRLH